MEQKVEKKLLVFYDTWILIVSSKFSESSTGYLDSRDNLLKNTTKTSPNTRGDLSKLNFCDNDEKT